MSFSLPLREVPLSRAQRRLWIASAADRPQFDHYHRQRYVESFVLRVRRLIDYKQFCCALNRVIMTNAVCRNGYHPNGREQLIYSGTESYFHISQQGSSNFPFGSGGEGWTALGFGGIDIFTGEIPFRYSLGEEEKEQQRKSSSFNGASRENNNEIMEQSRIFRASFHHIAMDGASVRIIMRQLLENYSAYANGRNKNGANASATLPSCNDSTYCYALHSQKEAEHEQSVAAQTALSLANYWLPRLSRLWRYTIGIPARYSRAATENARRNTQLEAVINTNTCKIVLSPEATASLMELARSTQASLFSTCLAILRIFYYKLFGIRELPIGVPVSTRCGREEAKAVGLLLNLCVSCCDGQLNPSLSIREWVQRQGAHIREMLSHCAVPYDLLIAELRRKQEDESGFISSTSTAIPRLFEVAAIADTCLEDDFTAGCSSLPFEFITDCREATPPHHPQVWYFMEQKRSGTLLVRVHFDGHLFDGATIRSVMECYALLCERIALNSTGRIADLSLCKDAATLPAATLMGFEDFPSNCGPATAVYEQLRRLPADHKVLVSKNLNHSHEAMEFMRAGELLARSLGFAAALERKLKGFFCGGATPKVMTIALLMCRSAGLVSAVLGSWFAGHSVLILGWDWPERRIGEALERFVITSIDGEQRQLCLITERDDLTNVVANLPATISIFHPNILLQQGETELPASVFEPRRMASTNILYFSFTSGSSGQPKIVATEALGLMNLVWNYTEKFYYTATSIVYQVVNPSFDIFFADLLTALLNGAQLVLASDAIPRLSEIKKYGVTHAHIMPAYLARMRKNEELDILAGIKCLQFGGETIPADWLRLALKAGLHLVQLFGFTEHSVYTTYQKLSLQSYYNAHSPAAEDEMLLEELVERRLEVGQPFTNLSLSLVDDDGQPLPNLVGLEGNLRSGGIGVMRGYLEPLSGGIEENSSKKENAKCRLVELHACRHFDSGDRCRIVAMEPQVPGNKSPVVRMKFLGRADRQVKLNGNRVDLAEVERLAEEVPRVRLCFVEVTPQSEEETDLLAIIVPAEEGTFPASDGLDGDSNESRNAAGYQALIQNVNAHLQAVLPICAVPTRYRLLVTGGDMEALPLNSNGKMERRGLIECSVEVPLLQSALLQTPSKAASLLSSSGEIFKLEASVCALFSHLLYRHRRGTKAILPISATDDLFKLGADSLSLLLATQAVEEKLGVRLHLHQLFKWRTIQGALLQWAEEVGNSGKLSAHADLLQPQASSPKILATDQVLKQLPHDSIPLSYNQEHLWFLEKWSAGNKSYAYSLPFTLKFMANEGFKALPMPTEPEQASLLGLICANAVNRMVMNNAVLRTLLVPRYRDDGWMEGPFQQVLSGTECFLYIAAMGSHGLRSPQHKEKGRQGKKELDGVDCQWCFNSAEDVPIRINVVDTGCGEEEMTLRVTLNHHAVDGHSLLLILDQLRELVRPADEKNIHSRNRRRHCNSSHAYSQFALAQRSRYFTADIDYWTAELGQQAEGIATESNHHLRHTSALKTDQKEEVVSLAHAAVDGPQSQSTKLSHPAAVSSHSVRIPLIVDDTLLQELMARLPCSFVQLALAVYLMNEAERSGNKETVTVAVPFAGREPSTLDVVGYFVNVHALRFPLPPTLTLLAIVDCVKEKLLAAQSHSIVPLQLVMKAIQPTRREGRGLELSSYSSSAASNPPMLARMFAVNEPSTVRQTHDSSDYLAQQLGGEQRKNEIGMSLWTEEVEIHPHHSKFDECWILTREKTLRNEGETTSMVLSVEYDPFFRSGEEITRAAERYAAIFTTAMVGEWPGHHTDQMNNRQASKAEMREELKEEGWESELLNIWAMALERGNITSETNFFEAGGHSLLAVRIASCIERRLNIRCDVRDIFRHQSVRKLAQYLLTSKTERLRQPLAAETLPNVGGDSLVLHHISDTIAALRDDDSESTCELPTCCLQDQLLLQHWHSIQAGGGSNGASKLGAYELWMGVDIVEAAAQFDFKRLTGTLRALVARNPSLRVIFGRRGDGTFFQRLLLPGHRALEDKLDAELSIQHNKLNGNNCCGSPLDPFSAPPWRMYLLRVENEGFIRLLLRFSHLIMDGTSIGIITKQLWCLYHHQHSPPVYPPVHASDQLYANMCEEFNLRCRSEEADRTRAMDLPLPTSHRVQLAEFSQNRLLPDHGRSMEGAIMLATDREELKYGREGGGHSMIFKRCPGLNALVGAICRKHGAFSPLTILLHSLGRVLRQRMASYGDGFNIGVVKDVRIDLGSVGADAITGLFINTLVIPFPPLSQLYDATIVDQLTTIQSIVDAKFAKPCILYNSPNLAAVPADGQQSSLLYSPLFQVMLAVDNANTPFPMSRHQNAGHSNNSPSTPVHSANESEWFHVLSSSKLASAVNGLGGGAAKFDCTFFFKPVDDGDAEVSVEYVPALYHHETVECWAEAWCEAIRTLHDADSDATILKRLWKGHPLILTEVKVDFPSVCPCLIIYQQARRTPAATAIQLPSPLPYTHHDDDNDHSISYSTLVRILAALARHIRADYHSACGVPLRQLNNGSSGEEKGNGIVAVCGRRNSVEALLLSLAVMWAGGAYLPIDVGNTPPARQVVILEEAGVGLTIGAERQQQPHEAKVTSHADCWKNSNETEERVNRNRRVIAEELANQTDAESSWESYAPCPVDSTALAYVIFTSGTTGSPKGVCIGRAGMVNMLVDATRQFGVQPLADCIYAFTSFCFDNSVLEMFLALVNGARLFVDDSSFFSDLSHRKRNLTWWKSPSPRSDIAELEQGSRDVLAEMGRLTFSARKFSAHVERYRITHAFLFPALVEAFDDEWDEDYNDNEKKGNLLSALAKLKYWISGAEKLPGRLMQRALKAGVRVQQVYGPTECTCYVLRRRMQLGDHPQNLGNALPNCQLSVRTPSGEEAIPYAVHQLYVSGVGVMAARGYLGAGQKNSNTPERSPFAYFTDTDGVHRRYYPTGDLVQLLPSDEILYVGRADSQVKMRGYRVDLDEVESVLATEPIVKSAKVVLGESGLDLTAYVVPYLNVKLNADSIEHRLREHCRQHLAFYMVPRRFHYVEAIPLTPNCKIDTRKLCKGAATHVAHSRSIDDHQSSIPAKTTPSLVETIASVLGVKMDEVFFAENMPGGFVYLGGNSLNAEKLVNMIISGVHTHRITKKVAEEVWEQPATAGWESTMISTLLSSRGTLGEFMQLVEEGPNGRKMDWQNRDEPALIMKNPESVSSAGGFDIDRLPLSFQQEQMYYLAELEKSKLSATARRSGTYTLPLLQIFHHSLDIPALHHAFHDMLQQQTALRMAIVNCEGRDDFLCQQVLSATETFFACPSASSSEIVEMSERDVASRIEEMFTVESLCSENSRSDEAYIEQEDSPLLKCRIFKTERHYILLTLVHHMCCDAHSTQLMEHFMQERYAALRGVNGKKEQREGEEKMPGQENSVSSIHANNTLPLAYTYQHWAAEQKSAEKQRVMHKQMEKLRKEYGLKIAHSYNLINLFIGEQKRKITADDKSMGRELAGPYHAVFQVPTAKIRATGVTAFTFFCTRLAEAVVQCHHQQHMTRNTEGVPPLVGYDNDRGPDFHGEKNHSLKSWIIIGAPTTNRSEPKTRSIVGNFLNNILVAVPMWEIPLGADKSHQNSANRASMAPHQNLVKSAIEEGKSYSNLAFIKEVEALREFRQMRESIGYRDTTSLGGGNLNADPSRQHSPAPLYDVYLNCRYNLEAERTISEMPDMPPAEQSRTMRERLLSTTYQSGGEHLLEICVDELDSANHLVRVLLTPPPPHSFAEGGACISADRVGSFFATFKKLCTWLKEDAESELERNQVSERVRSAIVDSLPQQHYSRLAVEDINSEDSFFSLGGNSLLLLRLRRKMEKAFERENVSVDLNVLAQSPTVGAIEKHIRCMLAKQRGGGNKHEHEVVTFNSAMKMRSAECIHAQKPLDIIHVDAHVLTQQRAPIQLIYDSCYSNATASLHQNTAIRILVFFPSLIGGCTCYAHLFHCLEASLGKANSSSIIDGSDIEPFVRVRTVILAIGLPLQLHEYTTFDQLTECLARTLSRFLPTLRIEPRRGRQLYLVFAGASIGATFAYEAACVFGAANAASGCGSPSMAQTSSLLAVNCVVSIDGRADWQVPAGFSKEMHRKQMVAALRQHIGIDGGTMPEKEQEDLIAMAWHLLQLRRLHKLTQVMEPERASTLEFFLLKTFGSGRWKSEDECGAQETRIDWIAYGWDQLGVKLKIRQIDGNHDTMLDPSNVPSIAQELVHLLMKDE